MLLNIEPLRKYREYRLLFIGQVVSFLGSMVSYVAIPYQIFDLTQSNKLVGLMGLVQLGPTLVFGLLGGTYADRLNRRRLLLVSEAAMCLLVLGLMINSWQAKPSVALIFVIAALMQAVLGFHRPAMDAMNQALVDKSEYAAIGALGSLRYTLGAIGGPAIAGAVIAAYGIKGAYLLDVLTFTVALYCLWLMKTPPTPQVSLKSPWADTVEGMRYAWSKPELMGTYIVDIVAMVFAFPIALFPAMSQTWGGAKAVGVLFASMAVGGMVMTLFSGWTGKVHHHGRGVVVAATFWALFIIGVGFSSNLWMAAGFLALAGGADMVSGLFRGVIWNQTVPNTMRGRLSGIEMISYISGPLLGNARAGWMAERFSVAISLYCGGIICFLAVILTAVCLPRFWRYKGQSREEAPAQSV